MSNIVIFGATQSGKTTLLGFLATAMLRHPQFNEEVYTKLKLIKKLTINDDFSIGNPRNPVNVNKDIIFPSFVSLDKNELKKFTNESTIGTTKRIHRKQLSLCMSDSTVNSQNENENISCTFVDLPGFRQRLSDKYRGFFEGDVGIAMLKLREILEFNHLLGSECTTEVMDKIYDYENRLFEPIRVWCDYRSPSRLVIVISQIDQSLNNASEDSGAAIQSQINDIEKAVSCIKEYIKRFNRDVDIPICPISIKITASKNEKKNQRMNVFFHREGENIYEKPKDKILPGSGTFISCLKKVMPVHEKKDECGFFMANVNQVMKAIVNGTPNTALNVRALHGTISKSDIIKFGPIVDKRSNTVSYAQCTISSIKADGADKPSGVLLEGNVGGIIFSDVRELYGNHRYCFSYKEQESEISILDSTILYNGKLKQGNIVELEIYMRDYITINGNIDDIYNRVLRSLMPFDQVYLFWYGKMVSVNIVEILFLEDKVVLSAIISKDEQKSLRLFATLCDEDNIIKFSDNVLLAIPRSYYSSMSPKNIQNKFTYVSCSISDIKNEEDFDLIQIESEVGMCLCSVLCDIVHFDCEEDKNKVLINIPIKSPPKRIDIYSILTRVGKNMKKWFSRSGYRQLGGVNIKLINTK